MVICNDKEISKTTTQEITKPKPKLGSSAKNMYSELSVDKTSNPTETVQQRSEVIILH